MMSSLWQWLGVVAVAVDMYRHTFTNVKGKKGFLSIPNDQKKSKRLVYYLTENERNNLLEYCKKNNTDSSNLVRLLLKPTMIMSNQ